MTQEITKYQEQVSLLEKQANALIIDKQEDVSKASDILGAIKTVSKAVTERKKEIVAPLMESLASARDLFRPVEDSYKAAEQIIKGKLREYDDKEEERIQKQKEYVNKRVEKGTMRTDTAIDKLETLNIKTNLSGSQSKTSIRKIRKIRILDQKLIPNEYMLPNITKITDDVLRHNVSIAGVEIYEEKSIVSR